MKIDFILEIYFICRFTKRHKLIKNPKNRILNGDGQKVIYQPLKKNIKYRQQFNNFIIWNTQMP